MKLADLPDIEFVDSDAEKIKAAVFNDYTSITGRTLAKGDPVRLFLLVVSEAIIRLVNNQNYIGKQNLLKYASGGNLDNLGAFSDTTRIPASAATTTLLITLAAKREQETIVKAGTRVTTDSGIYFATNEDAAVLAGNLTTTVKATCQTVGTVGNGFLPGEIKSVVDMVAYVASIVNTTTSAGGADEESDDDYRERIHEAPEHFSTAGPTGAYEYWAKSANSGIIDVAVTSPSAGTVEIRPLMTGGTLPKQELLDAVKTVVSADKVRPLTDNVSVVAPDEVSYDIAMTYYTDTGTAKSTIKDAVAQAVNNYRLWQKSKIGRDINPSRLIADVMAVAGVKRVTLTAPTYTVLTDTQVAQDKTTSIVLGGSEDE